MAIVTAAADWTADAELSATPTGVVTATATWTAFASGSAAISRDRGGGKRIVITNQTGDAYATIENASNISVELTLNQWETFSFTIPADDPKLQPLLAEPLREAQVWYDDILLAWGPMVRPEVTGDVATIRGVGAMWYLSRRHVGKASRDNLLTNGDFEDGFTGWNVLKTENFLDYQPVGAGEASVELSVNVPGYPKKGTQVLQLNATMVEDPAGSGQKWGDVFAWQELVVAGGERGATLTIVAWAWVDTILSGFDDWEPHRFGPLLARLPTDWRTNNAWGGGSWGGTRAFYTDVIEVRAATLDERTPINQWVRLEASITVPPNTTQAVIARVSGISGDVYYDRVGVYEDTAFEEFDTEQVGIICELVTHAQDAAFDKSSVNLACFSTDTGIRRDLVLLHSQHANIWRSIQQFTELQDGVDIGTLFGPTARLVIPHYPHKGVYRPWAALAEGRNVASWRWAFDGEAATTSAVVLGTGSGSDREEASFIDATGWADDVILETIETVDADTPVEQLDSLAAEAWTVLSEPEVLDVTTIPNDPDNPAANFIGRIWYGDWVPVTLRRQGLTIETDYRITSMRLNDDDSLTFRLNRRDVP